MKIIYFITGLNIGGAETITVNLANMMSQRGNSVSIVSLSAGNEQKDRICKEVNVINLQMQKSVAGFVKALWRAKKIIKAIAPDVVHGNMIHANIFVRILRLYCKFPFLVCTEHSKNIESRFRMLLYRWTDRLSDINTNVSEEATRYFICEKAFSPTKSICMYNGIDLTRFRPDPNARDRIRIRYKIATDEFLYLHVGRLNKAKDQKNLIDAFAILHKKYQAIKLMIVGGGELETALEEYIQSLSLGNKIILAGTHTDIADYYNAGECFVLSSAWEGFGLVLAEAMACGLPVITTDAGGCAEVVQDRNFIVPTRDACSLGRKMEDVYLMSLDERKALGKKNRKSAYRFDLNQICMQWIHLYKTRSV